jgi:uncharacterized protein (DUF433 family)
MTMADSGQIAIIRTERGLMIAGTRITLYDVMDYVQAKYPSKFIQGLFDLTQEQINSALTYIEAHRAEVEIEYQQVLKEAEELRQYYEDGGKPRKNVSLRHELFNRSQSQRSCPSFLGCDRQSRLA